MHTKKTIATIDVNIVNAAEAAVDAASAFTENTLELDPIDWRAKFLDDQHNCPLCGSDLLVTHVTHFVNQTVAEDAVCEPCNVTTRQLSHALQ